MSKYTILGKYVFVSNDSMIAEFSNLMLIISEHDEKYIKKRDAKKWDKMSVLPLKIGSAYDTT